MCGTAWWPPIAGSPVCLDVSASTCFTASHSRRSGPGAKTLWRRIRRCGKGWGQRTGIFS